MALGMHRIQLYFHRSQSFVGTTTHTAANSLDDINQEIQNGQIGGRG
jgi:hypothetical protein